jgi:hypothetical protein
LLKNRSNVYLGHFIVLTKVATVVEYHKRVFDDLAKKLNIKTLEDWYQFSGSQIKELGAQRVMSVYNNSLPRGTCDHVQLFEFDFLQALATIYPDHNWMPWKFPTTPFGYWKDVDKQRTFMDSVAKELDIKSYEDWYKVSFTSIRASTKVLLHHYNDSMYQALTSIYPEYKWLPWRFRACPRGYWNDINNQRMFMDHVATVLNIQKPEDWYSVTSLDLVKQGGSTLVIRYDQNIKKCT